MANNRLCIRSEFLTIFWEMMPLILAEVYRRFWTTYCCYLQGQWVSQASRVSCVQRRWGRSPERTNMSPALYLSMFFPTACFPYSWTMKETVYSRRKHYSYCELYITWFWLICLWRKMLLRISFSSIYWHGKKNYCYIFLSL